MKVKDLIEILSKVDSELDVWLYHYETGCEPMTMSDFDNECRGVLDIYLDSGNVWLFQKKENFQKKTVFLF